MKESLFKRLTGFLIAAILILLIVLFFTNDFGLVDLRKTSVIIGVGVDYEGEDVKLTAQLAVPRAAENGENTEFTSVEGVGATVAEALDDINLKTGFYPKLVFCKLIVVGESCFTRDINAALNYFFTNEFTGLTPKIAACEGEAAKLFTLKLPFGDSVTDSVDRLLSSEAQKSANVSTVNLNEFGQAYLSASGCGYMPYITSTTEGESEGESEEGQSSSQSSSSESFPNSGGSESVSFDCGRTALFYKGVYKGVMEKELAFTFNLLNGDIRRAFIGCETEGEEKTLSVRGCKSRISLKVEGGAPVLSINFSAMSKLQDGGKEGDGDAAKATVPDGVLRAAEAELKGDIEEMLAFCKSLGCDILRCEDLLYKTNRRYYNTLKGGVFKSASPVISVTLKSVG